MGGAVAHLVGLSAIKSEVRGSNPSPGQISFSMLLCVNPALNGDLSLSGSPSGRGAGSGARTCDRTVAADLRADSLSTVPPTLQLPLKTIFIL
ncbi:hypothetical protein PoB_003694700 [Plakobranchus ocellatus]|uniref:Uncharacterized protein n=1 Tax=Plakobranchus ocellatus TaxID=259542 RepID=A0AAV4AU28_9GAST|nr:hypothetical protein PoB_003694700 [Plakobranchus ocellatus]